MYITSAMTRSYQFPELFGVVRIQPYRAPCLQFCTSSVVSRSQPSRTRLFHPSEHMCYRIQNLSADEYTLIDPRAHLSLQFLDQQIRTLSYRTSGTPEVHEVLYWHLPIRIYNRETNTLIPILEFQFRSWLPRDYEPFPLNVNLDEPELKRVLTEINQERLTRIRMDEDAQAGRSLGVDIRRFFGRPFGPDDSDDRDTLPQDELIGLRGPRTPPLRRARRMASSPPPILPVREEPEIRVMEVRVPVERVVIQTRASTLPTPVGRVLLDHARKGTETCPIAASPFSECHSLSVTSCFHVFDTHSLQRWRESHTTCPVCRSEVVNVVSEEA